LSCIQFQDKIFIRVSNGQTRFVNGKAVAGFPQFGAGYFIREKFNIDGRPDNTDQFLGFRINGCTKRQYGVVADFRQV